MNALRRSAAWLDRLPTRWVLALLWLLGAVLALRLIGLVSFMAVDIPFSDQWTILRSIEDGFQWADVLTAFRWQHGPHRQGLSFAFILPAYHFSHWSVRLDSLLMAGEQLLAGALMLRLRRQLVPGPWRLWDGVLLLVFWGVCTYETLLVAPNASHSIFPLLLLLLLANAWLWPLGPARLVALSGLLVGLTFTGFGITAVPAVAFVLLLAVWRAHGLEKRHAFWLLVVCGLSMAGFLVDYRFVVAADGFEAMRPNPFDYLHFMAVMFGHFLVMVQRVPRWILEPAGWLLFAALVMLAVSALIMLVKPRSAAVVDMPATRFREICLMFVGCTLAFALLTAYGRVQLGLAAATASRYTALLMPGVAAIVLLLFKHRQRLAPVLLALLMLFALRAIPETRKAWLQTRYYTSMKLCWLESYRPAHDFEAASERVRGLDGFRTFQPVWMGDPGTWQMLAEQKSGPFAPGAANAPFSKVYPRPCEVLQAP